MYPHRIKKMYVVITHATTLQMRVVHLAYIILLVVLHYLQLTFISPLMNVPILVGTDFLHPLWCFT